MTASEIAKKYASSPNEAEAIELDILRLLGEAQEKWYGRQEHQHHWEDEFPVTINGSSISGGSLWYVCKCGARRQKYVTF